MAKETQEILDLTSALEKFNEVIHKQISILEDAGKAIKNTYKPIPSELMKQMKEMQAIELKAEKIRQESLKTQKLIDDATNREIKSLQNKEAQERKNLKLRNDFVSAMARQQKAEERSEQQANRVANRIKEQSSAYNKLSQKHLQARKTLQDLLSTENANSNAVKKAQKEYDILDSKIKKVDASVKVYSRNVGNYSSAFSGLGSLGGELAGALGWVGAIATVVQIGKSFYNVNKELQSLNMSMRLGSKDSEAYASNVQFLEKVTEKYGLELISTSQAYNKFYIASKNKLALEDIQLIFDKVSKSASLMGLSVYDQEGIFKALEQMMSKGTVQAEELRGQLGDRLPGAFEIMAKAVGVSTKELGDMMKEGKVLTSDVLPKFAIELEKAFGADKVDMIDNITSAENRMSNAWTTFVKNVEDGSGTISKLIKGIYNQITETIKGWDRLLNAPSLEESIAKSGETAVSKLMERAKKTGEDSKKLAETLYKQNLLNAKQYEEELTELIKKHQVRRKGSLEGLTTNVGYKRLRGALDKIAEENKAYYAFQNKEQEKFNNDTETTTKKLTKSELNELRRREEERKKAMFDYRKNELSSQIEQNKNTLLLDAKNKTQELGIQLMYNEERKKLVELDYQEELRLAKGVTEKVLLAKSKRNSELQKLDDDSAKINKELLQKQYDDALKLANMLEDNDAKNAMKSALIQAKTEQDRVKVQLKYIDKQKEILEDREKQDVESGKYTTNELLIIYEEYNQKRIELDQQANEIIEQQAKKAQENVKNYLSKFNDMGNFGFSSLNVFTTIEENGKSMFENLLVDANGWRQQMAIIVGSVGEVFKDVMSAMQDSSKARFDNEMAQLQATYETSVKFAGDSAEAKAQLDEELERKQKELRKRQAKRDKEFAIMNAIINTAQAVVTMLAQGGIAGFVLAGIAAALGAVQIATISSTPIPEFWKGTDNAPQGLAWTQEKGAEVITDKNNNIKTMGNNKGPQLTWLDAGDKVYKSQEDYFKTQRGLNNILSENKIGHSNINVNNEFDYDRFESIAKQNKSDTFVNIDEDGFSVMISRNKSRQNLKNKYARR